MEENLIIQNTIEYRDKFREVFDDLKGKRNSAREGIKGNPNYRMLAHPIDAFPDSDSALKELEKVMNKVSELSKVRRDWLLWLDSIVILGVTQPSENNEDQN